LSVAISDQPGYPYLHRFVQRALEARGEELEFVVLFGSRVKDTWRRDSDFDVLIGLREDDGKRFHERLADFEGFMERQIEPFIYSRSEIQNLFEQRHTLLLEALADGWVLFDRGGWAVLRAELEAWQRDNKALRRPHGWWLDPSLKPDSGGSEPSPPGAAGMEKG
jgi:predicted nucleotidyltransferase